MHTALVKSRGTLGAQSLGWVQANGDELLCRHCLPQARSKQEGSRTVLHPTFQSLPSLACAAVKWSMCDQAAVPCRSLPSPVLPKHVLYVRGSAQEQVHGGAAKAAAAPSFPH